MVLNGAYINSDTNKSAVIKFNARTVLPNSWTKLVKQANIPQVVDSCNKDTFSSPSECLVPQCVLANDAKRSLKSIIAAQCSGRPHMSQFSCPCWLIYVQCLHVQPVPPGDWDISTMSTSPPPRGSGDGAEKKRIKID